jgi:hypothetical protein
VSDEVGARAHLEAVREGDVALAIRGAIALGMSLLQRGEMAQSGGWLARAGRLIEESGYDGVERGPPPHPGRLAGADVGRPAQRFATFEQVAAIADRFGDRDLAALGGSAGAVADRAWSRSSAASRCSTRR